MMVVFTLMYYIARYDAKRPMHTHISPIVADNIHSWVKFQNSACLAVLYTSYSTSVAFKIE